LARLAEALAGAVSLTQMAEVVNDECRKALCADAICTYMLGEDGHFQMFADFGCTTTFRQDCGRIPMERIPLHRLRGGFALFLDSSEIFKRDFVGWEELVEQSGRQVIGYAPLMAQSQVVGLLGFSYNDKSKCPSDRAYILQLVDLCAQSLHRVRENERDQTAKREAENSSRAKSEFLANLSHEIRTPLGLIQGYTDLLCQAPNLEGEQKQWATIVRHNARQLVHLIGSVLDFAKIESAHLDLEKMPVHIGDFIEDLRTTAALRAREKGLELKFRQVRMPETVTTDPTRLRQILLNLIANALKFTLKGEVEVIFACGDKGMVEVFVRDSGIGISPEHHELLFMPFRQAENSTTRRFGGTGLGLTISRRYAEALGGDLQLLESVPNKGSMFRLRFPSAEVESPAVAEEVAAKPLHGVQLLLVDDSPDNQDLIALLLRRRGAQVRVIGNGRDAVEAALAEPFQVILMDLQMPGLTGFQAVQELRARGYNGAVVALTANALTSTRSNCFLAGFDDFVTKPVLIENLENVILRLAPAAALHH
jgi:hypothetical protein